MTNHESTSEQSNIPGKTEKQVQLTPQESGVPHQPDFSLVRVLFMVLILCGIGVAGWYLLIRENKLALDRKSVV